MGKEQTNAQPGAGTPVESGAHTGRRFRVRDHYVVGREKIREYAHAVRNRHGAHYFEPDARKLGHEGLLAPPTFASVIGMACVRALLDTVLTEYDLSQVLHTDQVFDLHRPLVAGDHVTSETRVESIRRFGDNDIIRIGFLLTDEHGDLLQSGSSTLVARRGAPAGAGPMDQLVMWNRPSAGPPLVELPAGSAPPRVSADAEPLVPQTFPNFDALTPGLALPTTTVRVGRGDLVNYAGVAGDPNPIHFSPDAARAVGLPTVVAHGLLTMGLAADHLTDWAGDPTAITSFGVRFAGFVPVEEDAPAELEFGGRVKSLDPPTRTATVALTGVCGERRLFGRALAEVRFA